MSLLRPFTGLRPTSDHVADVVAPPYDVLNAEEARTLATGKPWSFLHISKAEIDLPAGTDPYSIAVYAQAQENFRKMCRAGVLQQDSAPCYYVYRLVMGTHTQIGLVAVASCAAYDAGRIRKHEHTRPDKEDDRVRQIEALNAQTGPVFLTYRRAVAVDDIVARLVLAKPDINVTAHDGICHSFWVVQDRSAVEALTTAFDTMPYLYICDGHHRSAAAARVARTRREANPKRTGLESYEFFLAVAFPDNQMQILDYNRVVQDLNGLSTEQFLERIKEAFSVESMPQSVKPDTTGEFGMYLGHQWYRLRIKSELVPHADPVGRLDVSLLQSYIIAPVLGITDPRRDKRIDFVGGVRGLAELERRVNSGEVVCAFALYPTSLPDLMAVADADQVMPPKSTWFEPKLADGLVSHVLD